MRLFTSLILLLTFITPAIAQNLSIGGRVVQKEGDTPLPNANVIIQRLPDSSAAGGTVTGSATWVMRPLCAMSSCAANRRVWAIWP